MKPYGSKRSYDTEPRMKAGRALVKREGAKEIENMSDTNPHCYHPMSALGCTICSSSYAEAKIARIRQIINWTPITSDHRERQVTEIIAVLDGSAK